MTNSWMQIKVKPIGLAQPKRLDEHLMMRLPAVVEQAYENGTHFYKPADDGTYTVRVHDTRDLTVTLVKAVIEHESFEVVSEVKHED
jgi:hypothetical protein